MNLATDKAICALLAADATIKRQDAKRALAILRGQAGNADCAGIDYYTRKEAAGLLKVTPRTVTAWGKSGLLARVAIPGRTKALGFTRASVTAVLHGRRKTGG